MAGAMYQIDQVATDDKLKEVMVFYKTAMENLGWSLITYEDVEGGGALVFVKDIYDVESRGVAMITVTRSEHGIFILVGMEPSV